MREPGRTSHATSRRMSRDRRTNHSRRRQVNCSWSSAEKTNSPIGTSSGHPPPTRRRRWTGAGGLRHPSGRHRRRDRADRAGDGHLDRGGLARQQRDPAGRRPRCRGHGAAPRSAAFDRRGAGVGGPAPGSSSTTTAGSESGTGVWPSPATLSAVLRPIVVRVQHGDVVDGHLLVIIGNGDERTLEPQRHTGGPTGERSRHGTRPRCPPQVAPPFVMSSRSGRVRGGVAIITGWMRCRASAVGTRGQPRR
jgi:hypothetical protein